VKGLSWINFILGLWLIVAAFVFSTGASAVMAEEIVLGIIIAVLAYASALRPNPVVSWLVAIAGLWTLIAPSVIQYGMRSTSKANDVVVGVIVLVLGFANAVYRQSPARTRA